MLPRSSSSRRSRPRRSSMPPPSSFPESLQDTFSEDDLSFQNLFTHVDSPSKRPVISEVSRILAASSDVVFELPTGSSTRPPLSRSISLRSESALEPIAEEEAFPVMVNRDAQPRIPRIASTAASDGADASLIPRVDIEATQLTDSGGLPSGSEVHNAKTTMPDITPPLPPSPVPSERSQLLLIRADMHWRRSTGVRALHSVREYTARARTQWRQLVAARAWERLHALDRVITVWVRMADEGRRTLTNIAKLHRLQRAVTAWRGWIDARRRHKERCAAAIRQHLRTAVRVWRVRVGVLAEHRAEAVMTADMRREWQMRAALHALRDHARRATLLRQREATCRDVCTRARMHVAIDIFRALVASRTRQRAVETRHRLTACGNAWRRWRVALAERERARANVSHLVRAAARMRQRVCVREWMEAVELSPLYRSAAARVSHTGHVTPIASSTRLADMTLTTHSTPNSLATTTTTSVADATSSPMHVSVVARGLPLSFARDRRAYRFWRIHALSRALGQLRRAVGTGVGCRVTRATRWRRTQALRSVVRIWRTYADPRRHARRARLLAAMRQWRAFTAEAVSMHTRAEDSQHTCQKLRLCATVRQWHAWTHLTAEMRSQAAMGRACLAIRHWRRVVTQMNMMRDAQQHANRTHAHAAVCVLLRWARKRIQLRQITHACIAMARQRAQQRTWRIWRWIVLRRAALTRLAAVAVLWEQSRCARRALGAWRVALAARRLTLAREEAFRQQPLSSSHRRTGSSHTRTGTLPDVSGAPDDGGYAHHTVGGGFGDACGAGTGQSPQSYSEASRSLPSRYDVGLRTPLSVVSVALHTPPRRPRPRPRPLPRDLPFFSQDPQVYTPFLTATSEPLSSYFPSDAHTAAVGYVSLRDTTSLNGSVQAQPLAVQSSLETLQSHQPQRTSHVECNSLYASDIPADARTRSRSSRRPLPRPLPSLPPLSSLSPQSALPPLQAWEDL